MLPWDVGNYSNFVMDTASGQQGSLYQIINFHIRYQLGASPNMVPTLAAAIQVVVEFHLTPLFLLLFTISFCFLFILALNTYRE